MRITYVAKHESGGNDDEGAIAYALEQLGHTVLRLPETATHDPAELSRGDLLLFHKWFAPGILQRVTCRRAFWYFDLVEAKDPTLRQRSALRKRWMDDVTPHVDYGFMTDGDFARRNGAKYIHLTQGADERFVGRDTADERIRVLLVGSPKGGAERMKFVQRAAYTYNDGFVCVARGVHGPKLRALIASARTVVAPDAPVTDSYWSNRVYLMCGFGAFLLHPMCTGLAAGYRDHEDILFYRSWEHLQQLEATYANVPSERLRIARNALERTRSRHLYRHRCKTLLERACS